MLKCPACGRSGGPFRLKHQISADAQILRAWSCPCGQPFYASAGAERSPATQTGYTGFTIDWNGRSVPVRLQHITRRETSWNVGPWTITVTGPPNGPGTRSVTLWSNDETLLAEWRLEATWTASEVLRRIKATPLPSEVTLDLLARILVRILN